MTGSCWLPYNWLDTGCQLNNNEAMFMELTIAGIVAIILSLFFYRKQNTLSMKLFELENRPKLALRVPAIHTPVNIWEPFRLRIALWNDGLSTAIVKSVTVGFGIDDIILIPAKVVNNPCKIDKYLQFVNIDVMSSELKLLVGIHSVKGFQVTIKYTSENSNKIYSSGILHGEDFVKKSLKLSNSKIITKPKSDSE